MRLLLDAKSMPFGYESMPFGCMSMARLGAKYAEVGCKSIDTIECMYAAFVKSNYSQSVLCDG